MLKTLHHPASLTHWNVLVSTNEGHYRQAQEILEPLAEVGQTDFYNVLVLQADNPRQLLARLSQQLEMHEGGRDVFGRVVPVDYSFVFQSPAEFENKAKETVTNWLPGLANKSFHVRLHRRGFKGKLSSQGEEQFLDAFLLEKLQQAGTPGHISFDNPDAIIAIESVNQRAGLSLWTREELQRYPLLKLD